MEQVDHVPQIESETEGVSSIEIVPDRVGVVPAQENMLENTIVAALVGRGFTVVPHSDWMSDPGLYGKELVLQRVPYTTIYGHRGFTQFLIRSERYNLKVRIECHWQQVSGSVDEKLPYLYLNSIYALPEQDVVLIIGGGGVKAGAVKWLRKAVQKRLFQDEEIRHQKNIRIHSIEEFLSWVNSIGKRTFQSAKGGPREERQEAKAEKKKEHPNEQQLEFLELFDDS